MKFVDKDNESNGFFVYHNQEGDVEGVQLVEGEGESEDYVEMMYENGCEFSRVYISDIPKMIKALQAAYQEYQEYSNGKEQV